MDHSIDAMTKKLSVADIVELAGGRRAVSTASRKTPHEVTYQAVLYWESHGIHPRHWPLLMQLTGLTVDEIFSASELTKKKWRKATNQSRILSHAS